MHRLSQLALHLLMNYELPMNQEPDDDCNSCEGCNGCEIEYWSSGEDLDDADIECADD